MDIRCVSCYIFCIDNERSKRQHQDARQNNAFIRLLINSNQAGGIIGKGGKNITDLRNKTGVDVSVGGQNPKGGVGERVCRMVGSIEGITMCIQSITRRWVDGVRYHERHAGDEEFQNTLDQIDGTGQTLRAPKPYNKPQNQMTTLKILFPQQRMTRLVGRGGAGYRELEEVTGCRINVSYSTMEGSDERLITLNGNPDSLERATHDIAHILNEFSDDGYADVRLYEPSMGILIIYHSGSNRIFSAPPLPLKAQ